MQFATKDNFKLDSSIESDIKSYYDELIKSWESRLEINLNGLQNQYKLYREFFISKNESKNINDDLNKMLEYTEEIYLKNSNIFKKLIDIANKNMNVALNYYWNNIVNNINEYMIIKRDEFDFWNRAQKKSQMISDLIESVLKKELYFIVGLNYIDKGIDLKKLKYVKLADMIDILLNLDKDNTIISKKDIFKGVRINQFRNKEAHADIEIKDYTITICNKKFSIEELEQVFIEISRIRLFIKMHLNLSLEFYNNKLNKYNNTKEINMKSKIVELNSYLLERKIAIVSCEIGRENKKSYSKGEMFCSLEIEIENKNILESISLIPTLIFDLLPVFNSANNLPNNEILNVYIYVKLLDINKIIYCKFNHDEIMRIQTDLNKYSNNFLKWFMNTYLA